MLTIELHDGILVISCIDFGELAGCLLSNGDFQAAATISNPCGPKHTSFHRVVLRWVRHMDVVELKQLAMQGSCVLLAIRIQQSTKG